MTGPTGNIIITIEEDDCVTFVSTHDMTEKEIQKNLQEHRSTLFELSDEATRAFQVLYELEYDPFYKLIEELTTEVCRRIRHELTA